MLTTDQQAALRAEVQNDPKDRGYALHLPHAPGAVVDLLNAVSDSMLGPLRSTTAKAWAAAGPYAGIVDASNDHANPCRASCLVIRESFSCGDPIHIEDPRLQEMLAAWITNGICTQTQVDQLYALAQQPCSRAQVLGLPVIDVYDIIHAGVIS